MPTIYVYSRVSTPDQVEAIAMQNRVALAHKDYVISRDTAENLGVKRDWKIVGPLEETVSAFKLHFHNRPMGKWICENLQPGDHIVFARFDRYVRLTKDHVLQTEEFTKRGITVHFADLNVTIGTAAGDMIATFFSAIAQYYSQSLSERQKASHRERFVYGTKPATHCKVLLKRVSRKAQGLPDVMVLNRQAISYLRYVMALRLKTWRERGVAASWEECASALEWARVRHGDLAEYRPPHQRKDWCSRRIVYFLRDVRSSLLPPIRGARVCQSLIHGPDPFQMGRNPANNRPLHPSHRRRRESVYARYRELVNEGAIKVERTTQRRWSRDYDQCRCCHSTEYPHRHRGLCNVCHKQEERQRQQAGDIAESTECCEH